MKVIRNACPPLRGKIGLKTKPIFFFSHNKSLNTKCFCSFITKKMSFLKVIPLLAFFGLHSQSAEDPERNAEKLLLGEKMI